jgi:hypothetical protein
MDKRRKWFAVLLEEGLRLGVIDAEQIVRHATPSVLATDLPPDLLAEVLQSGISGEAFSPAVIVETLGPERLAEHVPVPVLWACLDEVAERIIADHPFTQLHRTEESVGLGVDPGVAQADEIPDIEVIEG